MVDPSRRRGVLFGERGLATERVSA